MSKEDAAALAQHLAKVNPLTSVPAGGEVVTAIALGAAASKLNFVQPSK